MNHSPAEHEYMDTAGNLLVLDQSLQKEKDPPLGQFLIETAKHVWIVCSAVESTKHETLKIG